MKLHCPGAAVGLFLATASSLFGVVETPKACLPEPQETPIAYSDIVECQLSPVGDVDIFTFQGTIGEIISVAILTTVGPGNPIIELYNPSGQVVRSEFSGFTQTLAASGTFRIRVVDHFNDQTVSFRFVLERIKPVSPKVVALPYGTLTEDELNPAVDYDMFVFAGTAGTTVSITEATITGPGNPIITVYDPDGIQVASVFDGTNIGLTKTGTYVILMSDHFNDQTVTYRLNLECLSGGCPSQPPPNLQTTLTGCTTCTAGSSVFSAQLSIPTGLAQTTELKMGFFRPDNSTLGLGDPHIALPSGFTYTGDVVRGPIPAGQPPGAWQFCARLLELELGQILAQSCKSFTVN